MRPVTSWLNQRITAKPTEPTEPESAALMIRHVWYIRWWGRPQMFKISIKYTTAVLGDSQLARGSILSSFEYKQMLNTK